MAFHEAISPTFIEVVSAALLACPSAMDNANRSHEVTSFSGYVAFHRHNSIIMRTTWIISNTSDNLALSDARRYSAEIDPISRKDRCQ